MRKQKPSQRNLYPHSAAKVDLLRKYIQIYLNVLNKSRFTEKIYLFDLFCGPGAHEDDGIGSPLIMLEEINNILSQDNNNNYSCYFNDFDENKIIRLRSLIEENNLTSDRIDINYAANDYRKAIEITIDKINKLNNKEKAFVFIDPYGYKDISVNDIYSLLSTKRTEVLLFLSTQFMFRFHKKATPESLKKFIEELVPENERPNSSTSIEFIENLKEYFKIRLGNEYYVDTFIIKRESGQYYCLFFFTSHIYGFEKMLEAKWNIDKQQGRGWQHEHSYNLFDTQKSTDTVKFEDMLKNFLLSPRTNKEIYEFTLHNNHLPRHAVDILSDLQKSGKLHIKAKGGGIVKRKSFYLSYQVAKKDPEKVLIKFLDT